MLSRRQSDRKVHRLTWPAYPESPGTVRSGLPLPESRFIFFASLIHPVEQYPASPTRCG